MAMTAAPAIAQTEPAPGTETSDPTDIIVTATKRNENLSQVPIAVSVTTDEDIAAKGIVRPQDYLISTPNVTRSEEHTSELQSLMRISYAVFCLQQKNTT